MPLFEKWFKAATAHPGVVEPNAMALATVDAATLQPSTRIVLLKGYDDEGFTWFTNYTSRKAGELHGNPRAALTFWWPALERQVHVRVLMLANLSTSWNQHLAPRTDAVK
jgi:pyridoxamine 5'-phosphate oxidase